MSEQPIQYHLILNPGRPTEQRFPLSPGRQTIGREPDNQIIFNDKSISRYHAELIVSEIGVILRDRGSTNGTAVNDLALNGEIQLRDGDRIRFGNLYFELSEREPELTSPEQDPPSLGTHTILQRLSHETTQFFLSDLIAEQPDGRSSSSILKLREKGEKRLENQLRILLEVGKQLSSLNSFETLVKTILDLLFQIMVIDRVVLILDPDVTQRTQNLFLKVRSGLSQTEGFYSRNITDHVFRTGESLLITDALTDDRFQRSQSVIQHSIHASMCVPLKPADHIIGVLYVDNLSSGDLFSKADLEFLTTLANQAAIAIENTILQERQIKSAIAQYELNKGQEIQKNFLPSSPPQIPGWDIHAYFQPARQVAGDFYDVFLLPKDLLFVVIADVCDKGVGSALFMALFRSLIRVFAMQQLSNEFLDQSCQFENLEELEDKLVNIASYVNNYVADFHADLSMFATTFLGVIQLQTSTLVYVNAGHEPPVVIGQEGIKATLKKTGSALGMFSYSRFKAARFPLELGDIVFSYTDGVTEAHNPHNELFSEHQLFTILERPYDSALDVLNQVQATVLRHIDQADQFDDMTMIAIGKKEFPERSSFLSVQP